MDEATAKLTLLLCGTQESVVSNMSEIAHLRGTMQDLANKLPAPPEPSFVKFPAHMPWPPMPKPQPPLVIPVLDFDKIFPPRNASTSSAVSCSEYQALAAPTATYTEFYRNGTTDCAAVAQAPKGLRIAVYAENGNATRETLHLSEAKCGFRSLVTFTTAHPGTVKFRSSLNAVISWIEANALSGGRSTAVAKAAMSASLGNTFVAAENATLGSADSSEAANHISYAFALHRSAQSELILEIPTAGTYSVVVDEWVTTLAATTGAWAAIQMSATWDPLVAELRGGCRRGPGIKMPSFGGYAQSSGIEVL
ncbi:MAG: hypothetical protein HYZ17_01820 [Betaproteobacteria bacterium]|nr:hypothetical protein [Betaproteobacteria bacterium]